MKEKSLIIFSYAILVLIGGLIGYLVANSLPSLIASSAISLLLFICAVFIWKGSTTAHHVATFLILCLFAFFGYRFFLTYKIFPAGMMLVVSGCLAGYLMVRGKKYGF